MEIPERYTDRFESSTYEDDPPVGIAVANPSTEEWVAWIPDRLWDRILSLARGYRLHVLGLVEGQERIELEQPHVESLLEELQLLAAVARDDLVVGYLEKIRAAAARVIGDPELVALVIETS